MSEIIDPKSARIVHRTAGGSPRRQMLQAYRIVAPMRACLDVPALKAGVYNYGAVGTVGKDFVAGAISLPIYGRNDWYARGIVGQ